MLPLFFCHVSSEAFCKYRMGSWVSATEDGEAEDQDEDMVDAQPSTAPKAEEQEQSMIREAAIGKGDLPADLACLQVAVFYSYPGTWYLKQHKRDLRLPHVDFLDLHRGFAWGWDMHRDSAWDRDTSASCDLCSQQMLLHQAIPISAYALGWCGRGCPVTAAYTAGA